MGKKRGVRVSVNDTGGCDIEISLTKLCRGKLSYALNIEPTKVKAVSAVIMAEMVKGVRVLDKETEGSVSYLGNLGNVKHIFGQDSEVPQEVQENG